MLLSRFIMFMERNLLSRWNRRYCLTDKLFIMLYYRWNIVFEIIMMCFNVDKCNH